MNECKTNDQVQNAYMYAKIPLTGNFEDDFIFKAELCNNKILFVDSKRVIWKEYTRNLAELSESDAEVIDVSCSELHRAKPLVSWAEFRQNPAKFASPEIVRVSENYRDASLGLIGWILGLKHTTVAFETRSGISVLLEKTADMGVWFRRPGWFERMKIRQFVKIKEGAVFRDIYEGFGKTVNFNPAMKTTYTCQHFSRDCINALEHHSAPKEELLNQWLFEKTQGFFKDLDEEHQNAWIRTVKSAGFNGWIHEKLVSWRCRLTLRRVEDYSCTRFRFCNISHLQ
jgi:hypothetical protein